MNFKFVKSCYAFKGSILRKSTLVDYDIRVFKTWELRDNSKRLIAFMQWIVD